ncbi:stage VI sporulation protein D [Oceanobacillus saliphilus]|uniref:stage VI sporulation protein D n=1 Tax=Oceanobacillus saliphilus TaxID=2925834 RepID=UPI00201E16E5|nr:stage VI sporulation protein D [Oceanobacillus saliphilus]
MTGDSKAFTFELQESLFFERGQEVAEMRGIALEPEISIQSYDEYISIKGIIELRGEYEKVVTDSSEGSEDDVLDFEDFQAKRYVEKVVDEDRVTVFSHRFPVEISVPPYRVSDLNEVTVNIESFDYELPEPSQLKMYASIEIHGINSEAEKPREDKEEETEEILDEFVDDEEDVFEFEIRKPIEEEAADNKEESTFMETEPSDEVIEQETMEIPTEEDNPDRWKYKSQTLSEFFNQLPEEKSEDVTASEDITVEVQEETIDTDSETDLEVAMTEDDQNVEQQIVEDATYLSDIFRSTEEESFTKMRLCIVQGEDTIESIAQRFSISPLQLIKHNDLDTDFEVHEGQLLYIPVSD